MAFALISGAFSCAIFMHFLISSSVRPSEPLFCIVQMLPSSSNVIVRRAVHDILLVGGGVEDEVVPDLDYADRDGLLPDCERYFLPGRLRLLFDNVVDWFLRTHEGRDSACAAGVDEVTIVVEDVEVDEDYVDELSADDV